MTFTEVVPPEPRRVVLAADADAQLLAAARELDHLSERLEHLEAEVEAAEARAGEVPDEADLPESAQLTLRFVDDLISTNRERIRDLLSERYAWAGDRLVEAHAEAQEIVNEALAELSLALRERDAGRSSTTGEPMVAELLASIASPAPVDDEPRVELVPTLAPDDGVEDRTGEEAGPEHDDDRDGDDLEADDDLADDLEEGDDREAEPVGAHFVKTAVVTAEEPTLAEPTVDDVVTSAVQAVLRAITEPAADTDAGATTVATAAWEGLGPIPEPAADLQPPAALVGAGVAAPSAVDAEFWGHPHAEDGAAPSRFRPRHVVIAMVLLVAAVIVALALIG